MQTGNDWRRQSPGLSRGVCGRVASKMKQAALPGSTGKRSEWTRFREGLRCQHEYHGDPCSSRWRLCSKEYLERRCITCIPGPENACHAARRLVGWRRRDLCVFVGQLWSRDCHRFTGPTAWSSGSGGIDTRRLASKSEEPRRTH